MSMVDEIDEVRRQILELKTILREFDAVLWDEMTLAELQRNTPDHPLAHPSYVSAARKLASMDLLDIRMILKALYNTRLAKHALGEFEAISRLIDSDPRLEAVALDGNRILLRINEELRVTKAILLSTRIIDGSDAA